MTPRVLVTPGEPAGVGPELTVRLAQSSYPSCELIALADPELLDKAAFTLKLPIKLREINLNDTARPNQEGELAYIPVKLAAKVQPGKLNPSNAAYVLNTLQQANDLCCAQKATAVVTGPVQKSIINDAGFPFSGHTEFFAEQSHCNKVVMMLATSGLRVALVTTHLPLKDVAEAINQDELEQVIRILHSELVTKFAISQPKILVAGLNPHAGEGGHLGKEEQQIITPTLEKLRVEGMQLNGPLPADTLFTPPYLEHADAVLAMYHDQGLPVLKYKGFGHAVNITLGLPYIRTSVDHGTALDLAGKGLADVSSFQIALKYAIDLTQHNMTL